MCAIFGVWGDEFSNTTNNLHSLHLMQLRGPDSFDYLSLPKEKIFFGHRRLSIIDLSNGGSQPMKSFPRQEDLQSEWVCRGSKL